MQLCASMEAVSSIAPEFNTHDIYRRPPAPSLASADIQLVTLRSQRGFRFIFICYLLLCI